MNLTARRLRSMGWIATLFVCAALVMILAFRVNALRSQVHQSDMKIIALKQETMYLETEFETRASQQQLKAWNDVEFGYAAPTASQYLDNERQLASYAKPAEPGAPTPIRVASADDAVVAAAAFPALVSPLSGRPMGESADDAGSTGDAKSDDAPATPPTHHHAAVPATGLAGLGDRLATVRHADDAPKSKAKGPAKDTATAKLTKKKTTVKSARAKPVGDKPAAKAFAGHVLRTKDHLASADTHKRVAGSPLIKLALKDVKTVK